MTENGPEERQMDPGQLARATAALDAWFDPGPGGYRAPGLTWDQRELQSMHAALEAPTTDAALEAFGAAPGSDLSTPEQDARNRVTMTELRQLLSPAPGNEAPAPEAQADPEARDAGGAISSLEPGTGEYAYEVLMSDAEREECDRQLRTAAEERAAAAEARLAGLERDAATLGHDIFGRPLAPEAPQAEADDQGVTSEVHGVQADLYDARAAAFYAAAGKPEPETEADREAEAGQ